MQDHPEISLSLSLSYSYLVLKQVFLVISEELSLACFFFFYLVRRKVCAWDRIHLGQVHHEAQKGRFHKYA